MMYNGSIYDSGQMADVQSVRRPLDGPSANWPESKHHLQQQDHGDDSDGQPVSVRVMTNGTGAPSERSDNYVRPFGSSQPEPSCPSHLAFLYDRAQQPIQPPGTGTSACPNGYVSPRADGLKSPQSAEPGEYRSLGRAVPAPMHHQQRQTSTPATQSSTEASTEYNPISRATPAPLHQHSEVANTSSTAAVSPSADTIHHANTEPRTDEVSRQMSRLSVGDGHQQSQQSTPPTGGVSPVGSHRAGRAARQPPPSVFCRRQSAPGPIGQSAEPGSRKLWCYTPSFGVGSSAGRVAPHCPRPIVQASTQNGTHTPRVRQAEANATGDRDAIDSASIRYRLREDEDPIADYDETSIRYRGRMNPSKTFRLLQTATGKDSDSAAESAYATTRRHQPMRRQPSRDALDDYQLQQPHADDIVDISYVGASIPSRTFRNLQEAIGAVAPQGCVTAENGVAPVDNGDDEGAFIGSGRNVRVVHLRPMKKHSSVDNILSCTDL